jgi:hypothetical protein
MGTRLASLVALLVLAGCSTLPHPFRPRADSEPNPLAAVGGENAGVRVAVVEGPALPMARLLSQSVAAELVRLNVPAAVGEPDARGYVLKGRTEINESSPQLPYIVLTHWTLLDRDGRALGARTVGVEGTWMEWDYGDARIIADVGRGVAEGVARLIQGDDGARPRRQEPAQGLWVDAVEGAPGDGNRSLALAMRAALKAADVPMARSAELARFRLLGAVALSPAGAGEDRIRIVWTVSEADGREIGRAVQQNTVPRGSLGGAWGQIAGLAAEAAVDGVADIVDRASARLPRVATAKEALEMPAALRRPSGAAAPAAGPRPDPGALPPPPPADLKRAPGKAPPPQ